MRRAGFLCMLILLMAVAAFAPEANAAVLIEKNPREQIREAIRNHKNEFTIHTKNRTDVFTLFQETVFSRAAGRMDKMLPESVNEHGDYNYWSNVRKYTVYSPKQIKSGAALLYEYRIKVKYSTTKKQQRYIRSTIAKAAKSVAGRGSVKTKSNAICRWIAKRMQYKRTNDAGIYNALKQGRGQCTHYSLLFYEIGKRSGLNVRIVTGDGRNGRMWEGHMWCIVRAGGKWYQVDPCWADQGKSISTTWIMRSKDHRTFKSTHRLDREYKTAHFRKYFRMAG